MRKHDTLDNKTSNHVGKTATGLPLHAVLKARTVGLLLPVPLPT